MTILCYYYSLLVTCSACLGCPRVPHPAQLCPLRFPDTSTCSPLLSPVQSANPRNINFIAMHTRSPVPTSHPNESSIAVLPYCGHGTERSSCLRMFVKIRCDAAQTTSRYRLYQVTKSFLTQHFADHGSNYATSDYTADDIKSSVIACIKVHFRNPFAKKRESWFLAGQPLSRRGALGGAV